MRWARRRARSREPGPSIQRRLLLLPAGGAPLVWLLAGLVSIARHEVDELFDTELIRLARQVQGRSRCRRRARRAPLPMPPASAPAARPTCAIWRSLAVWTRDGRLLLADRARREPALPARETAGFADSPSPASPGASTTCSPSTATGWWPPARRPTSARSWRWTSRRPGAALAGDAAAAAAGDGLRRCAAPSQPLHGLSDELRAAPTG